MKLDSLLHAECANVKQRQDIAAELQGGWGRLGVTGFGKPDGIRLEAVWG